MIWKSQSSDYLAVFYGMTFIPHLHINIYCSEPLKNACFYHAVYPVIKSVGRDLFAIWSQRSCTFFFALTVFSSRRVGRSQCLCDRGTKWFANQYKGTIADDLADLWTVVIIFRLYCLYHQNKLLPSKNISQLITFLPYSTVFMYYWAIWYMKWW